MHRAVAVAAPGVALATVGGLWSEVRRAANAPLPHFEDIDASGRYGTPGAAPLRIAVLGDSSCTGPGLADPTQIWVARIAAGLDRDVELVSVARGGARAHDVLAEQVPAALDAEPDLTVVSVGANDAVHLTPARRFASAFAALLEHLTAVAPVVTPGVGDLSVVPRVPRSLRAGLALRCATIDRLHGRVCDALDGVVRIPARELSGHHFATRDPTLFAADLFHPSARGHAIWADCFAGHVQGAVAALGPAQRSASAALPV